MVILSISRHSLSRGLNPSCFGGSSGLALNGMQFLKEISGNSPGTGLGRYSVSQVSLSYCSN